VFVGWCCRVILSQQMINGLLVNHQSELSAISILMEGSVSLVVWSRPVVCTSKIALILALILGTIRFSNGFRCLLNHWNQLDWICPIDVMWFLLFILNLRRIFLLIDWLRIRCFRLGCCFLILWTRWYLMFEKVRRVLTKGFLMNIQFFLVENLEEWHSFWLFVIEVRFGHFCSFLILQKGLLHFLLCLCFFLWLLGVGEFCRWKASIRQKGVKF